MSNYKFHIDKPLPDSEQINRHKDFGRLYGQYETASRFGFWRKLIRNPRLFASVVLLGVVVWLVFEVGDREKVSEGPLIQPQMEVNVGFSREDVHSKTELPQSCSYRLFNTLEMYYAAGIPLKFESAGKPLLFQADRIVQVKDCDFFPPRGLINDSKSVSDSIYTGGKAWYILDEKTGEWVEFLKASVEQDSAFLAQGSFIEIPAGTERAIRILDDKEKNLSRRLGKNNRKAFLVLPEKNTLFPIPYEGEGKHILPFVPKYAVIWAVDADGQWWEVNEATFADWQHTEAINIHASKRILGPTTPNDTTSGGGLFQGSLPQ